MQRAQSTPFHYQFPPYNLYPVLHQELIQPPMSSKPLWTMHYPQSFYYGTPLNEDYMNWGARSFKKLLSKQIKQHELLTDSHDKYPNTIYEKKKNFKPKSKLGSGILNIEQASKVNKRSRSTAQKETRLSKANYENDKDDKKEDKIRMQELSNELDEKLQIENESSENSQNNLPFELLFLGIGQDIQLDFLQELLQSKLGLVILNIQRLTNDIVLIGVPNLTIAMNTIEAFHGIRIDHLNKPLNITLSTESSLALCEIQLERTGELRHNSHISKINKSNGCNYTTQVLGKNEKQGSVNKKSEPVKLSVKGLPRNICEEDLFNVFSRYGRVESIQIMRHWTNKFESWAIVHYSHKSMALNAIRCLDGHYKIYDSLRPLSLKVSDFQEIPNDELA